MTQDEVIEMAKDAGFDGVILEMIAHTYKLGAEEEREACAKLVEGSGEEMSDKNWDSEYEAFAVYAARTIRARGKA